MNSLCSKKDFYLFSSNALNNQSSVFLLPANLPHNIQLPKLCLKKDFIHSSYLIQINSASNTFHEQFLDKFCSQFQSKFSFTIEENSLPIGSYLFHLSIANIQSNEIEHYIQPIEIFPSNITKKIEVKPVEKVNYTLLCYPQIFAKDLFTPHGLQTGEYTQLNQTIPWKKFRLIFDRPELNFDFYDHECLSAKYESHAFLIDPETREMLIDEDLFNSNNQTLYFDLIKNDFIRGKTSITRRTINEQIQKNFITIERIVTHLNNFVVDNDPKQAIDVVEDLAERLNQISQNSVKYFFFSFQLFLLSLFSIEFCR